MVDLAREAFSTHNFDLAADIYERSIKENGPTADLYLGLADSFAKGGKFSKAFSAYSKAYRLGTICPGKLKHLVTALVNTVKQESPVIAAMNKNVIFDCLYCRNLLNDPVTIPCGHTFCRTCLLKDRTKTCKNCGTVNHYLNVSRISSNVLLLQVINKWFPSQVEAGRLKKDANVAFQSWKYEEAVRLYSKAIELAPNDHLLWSNRSHAYASEEKYKEAYHDAEVVLKLRPDWPKGYFRKGCALYGLGKYEEAVVALLQCLALDTSVDTAKEYLSKALHNILAPLGPDDPKSVERQRQLNPSLLDQLIQSNFSSSILIPTLTVDTVLHLKEIISDTLATASNFLEGTNAEKATSSSEVLQHASAVPDWMQAEGVVKCRSAPNSRTSSPVTVQRLARFGSSDLGNQHCDDISMATSPSPQDQQMAKEKKHEQIKLKVQLPDVDHSLIDKEDFECALCYRLLYHPVTTPCGHVFCRQCLDRCLDHKSDCPLCKSSLAEYLAERRQAITVAVEGIISGYFHQEYQERQILHEEEIAELARMGLDQQHEIPIFVCTLAYPAVSCPLHIFEPRYRLMVRQCMESGRRQFGMCIATGDEENAFSDYGCILEIREVQYFPDGRSLVDCMGGKRFRVLSRGQRDGYQTAKVEFLADNQPEGQELEELKLLSQSMYSLSKNWFESLPLNQQQQITQSLGQFPAAEMDQPFGINGPMWHWWVTAILPLDPRIQLAMLAMTSYKERLQGLGRVLGYLNHKRGNQ